MGDKKQNSKPATKSDLLAVQTELNKKIDSVVSTLAATKSDLLAVQTELKSDIERLDKKIDLVTLTLDKKIDSVYTSQISADTKLDKKMDLMLDKINDVHSRIMSAFEQTVVKGAKYDQKAETHGGILIAHEDKLSNHEHRISLLETKK